MTEEQNNLPQIPKGWAWTQLGEISETILGQSPPSSTYNEDGNGLPFYQGKSEFGKIHPTPRKWCTAPKKIAEKGDVLISVRAPVGPTNVCPQRSCIGRGLAAIRGLGGIGTPFILYLMREFENAVARKGTGTTFKAITGSRLKGLEIPLPPLPEQGRIVSKIEELFAQLDAGIESIRKVKNQLKRYRQAALKYAFTGKLTEEWRKTHEHEIEPASMLLERIKEEQKKKERGKYRELPPVDTSNLSELPESWIWTRLGEVAEIILGQSPPSSTYNIEGIGLPFYQGKKEFGDLYPTPQKWCTAPKKVAEKGAVLISVRAPVGPTNICPEKSCIGRGLAAIRGLDGIGPRYILYLMRAGENVIAGKGTGTTFKAIRGKQLRELEIQLPSISEQLQTVGKIERWFSVANEVEKVVKRSLMHSEQLRRSILKKAFEGRLVPQDPTDEPAEKLLERIKEEKEKRKFEEKRRSRREQMELVRYVK